MIINFHNNNQMNLMNMLQQGIGMFCGNNMFQQGINMLGGNNNMFGMNGSLFNFNGGFNIGSTNMCSIMGYAVNYDAMAGMAVANSVMGTISQAVSSSQAEKQNDRAIYNNNKTQIENIDKQIANLGAEQKNPKVDDKYNQNIETAKKRKDELEPKKDKTEAENAELKKLNGDDKTEGSIKYLEKEKTKAEEAKQAEIQAKIDALKAQKAKLQKEVDSVELDDADGRKLQRLSDEKYNASLNEDGTVRDDVKYTKKHARTAVNHFMKALDNSDDKLKAAKTLVAIYGRLDSNDKTKILQNATEIAQRYIDEHKDTKS